MSVAGLVEVFVVCSGCGPLQVAKSYLGIQESALSIACVSSVFLGRGFFLEIKASSPFVL